jgi:putative transposase
MPFSPSSFQQLLKPLDRRQMDRIVERHAGDRGVGKGSGAWTCQRHLKALLFAQLSDLNSLREIEQGLDAGAASLYHLDLRPARRTTLSDASARRPVAVFRDICQLLMVQASRKLKQEGQELIRLLDSTPIQLRDPRLSWVEADNRTTGLKVHVLYDSRAQHPVALDISSPKLSDIAAGRQIELMAGTTYVFDKAYADYDWWYQIDQAQAFFVTRLKTNACRRQVRELEVSGEAIMADRRLKIGHKAPRGGKLNPLFDTELREIVVERPGKDPLHLVTNDLTSSPTQIADLYKERWQIELFFKWIKQNLKIKSFLGRSQNAIRIQIYVAIIAFLLLRMFKADHKAVFNHSLRALKTRLKVALFDPFIRTRKPPIPPNPNQLELRFQP